jgi:hypothetical protein
MVISSIDESLRDIVERWPTLTMSQRNIVSVLPTNTTWTLANLFHKISTYLQSPSWNNVRSCSRKILHPFRLRHQAQTDTKYSRKGAHSPQPRRHVPHKRKNDDSCYGY